MSKNQKDPKSLTTVKVEWGLNMEEVVSVNFSDGPYNKATVKGRCKHCWGGLIGRSNEAHAVTGISCLVCGTTLEGSDAEEEKKRMSSESTLNLMNMRLGRYPKYNGDGVFAHKVFPPVDRLTDEEIRERIGSKAAEGGKRNKLTRNNFPAGSPGWFYLQAKILMAGVKQTTSPKERSVVDFPEFDVKDDGAIVVHLSREEIEKGSRHREHSFMRRMGSTMSQSMISAFACELAMKAISLTCKDEAIKTHDLLDLFNDLTEESQSRIKADYLEIEEVIEQGRQIFGGWRYFEQNVGGKGMVAMIDTARAHALGKAARVILDEAEMVGLRGTVKMDAKENVRIAGQRRIYDHKLDLTVTGNEWPPRT